MKNVFKSLMLLLTLAVVMPSMQSCKKYEEGPAFSLRTKKARFVNKWKVDKYEINDEDATTFVDGFTYDFQKDGTAILDDGDGNSTAGTWEFTDGKEKVVITSDGDSDTWTIMRLKHAELICEYEDGNGNKHRIEFAPAD